MILIEFSPDPTQNHAKAPPPPPQRPPPKKKNRKRNGSSVAIGNNNTVAGANGIAIRGNYIPGDINI